MKYFWLSLLLTLPLHAQVAVAPILQPHANFVNGAGLPCAGCTLQSFAAGTTTPIATYTDSTGTSTNTNPIVLDAAGGAQVWMAFVSYKFVLKTPLGSVIWTVDNVKGGGGLGGICGPSGAIQISNGAVNGLTCDSSITINTTNHTLNVGTLPTNHVTIVALGTPTAWTLDTTTPTTACSSLGCSSGTVSSVGLTTPAWLTVGGSPVTGAGVLAITATPALTANQFLATPDGVTGVLAPRNIVAADLPLATTSAFGAVKPDGTSVLISAGVISAVATPPATTQSGDLSGSRSYGSTYQNTSGLKMWVTTYGATGGSGTSEMTCLDGPSSPTITLAASQQNATASGANSGITCLIPDTYFYRINASGTAAPGSPSGWYETTF